MVVGSRHRVEVVSDLRGPDRHQPLRFRVRERLEEHGVEHAEDRRVGADSERKCDHSHKKKARAAPQGSQRVTQVPRKVGQQHPAAAFPLESDLGILLPTLDRRSSLEPLRPDKILRGSAEIAELLDRVGLGLHLR